MTSIQDYSLLELLGEGSTAHVYLAQHVESGDHVAIKVIDKLFMQHENLESRVQRELILHKQLDHPSVLHVKEVFEDDRNYYMALEYCERRSLTAVLKANPPPRSLDLILIKQLFQQVVQGVAYLHETGVIHRDLKLGNILVTSDWHAKISDFGLAARTSEEHASICGTPNFIAPEILESASSYGTEVDIWSLGCLLHCLLLHRPPFQGKQVGETLANIVNSSHTPLELPSDLDRHAADLIRRLLSSEPSDRPQAREILTHPWLHRTKRVAKKRMKRKERKRQEWSSDSDSSDDNYPSSLSDFSDPVGSIVSETEPLQDEHVDGSRVDSQEDDSRSVVLSLAVDKLPPLDIYKSTLEVVCREAKDMSTSLQIELAGNQTHLTYCMSSGRIDGTISGRHFHANVLEQTYTSKDIVHICHFLTSRLLHLRSTALRLDRSQWPMYHYESLPPLHLPSALETDLRQRLHQNIESTSAAHCAIVGIGIGYLQPDGSLILHFHDESKLELNAAGDHFRFQRSSGHPFTDFYLDVDNNDLYLPQSVLRKLEHVPRFIRQLQVSSESTSSVHVARGIQTEREMD